MTRYNQRVNGTDVPSATQQVRSAIMAEPPNIVTDTFESVRVGDIVEYLHNRWADVVGLAHTRAESRELLVDLHLNNWLFPTLMSPATDSIRILRRNEL